MDAEAAPRIELSTRIHYMELKGYTFWWRLGLEDHSGIHYMELKEGVVRLPAVRQQGGIHYMELKGGRRGRA